MWSDLAKEGWGYVLFLISLALAAVFIYADVDKVCDPLQFADSIARSLSCLCR